MNTNVQGLNKKVEELEELYKEYKEQYIRNENIDIYYGYGLVELFIEVSKVLDTINSKNNTSIESGHKAISILNKLLYIKMDKQCIKQTEQIMLMMILSESIIELYKYMRVTSIETRLDVLKQKISKLIKEVEG